MDGASPHGPSSLLARARPARRRSICGGIYGGISGSLPSVREIPEPPPPWPSRRDSRGAARSSPATAGSFRLGPPSGSSSAPTGGDRVSPPRTRSRRAGASDLCLSPASRGPARRRGLSPVLAPRSPRAMSSIATSAPGWSSISRRSPTRFPALLSSEGASVPGCTTAALRHPATMDDTPESPGWLPGAGRQRTCRIGFGWILTGRIGASVHLDIYATLLILCFTACLADLSAQRCAASPDGRRGRMRSRLIFGGARGFQYHRIAAIRKGGVAGRRRICLRATCGGGRGGSGGVPSWPYALPRAKSRAREPRASRALKSSYWTDASGRIVSR